MRVRARRRTVALLAAAASALAGCSIGTGGAEVPGQRPLLIPPLATSTVDEQGRRVFTLDLAPGTTEFREGVATETWGANGSYLGPTIRAQVGEQVQVDVRNGLPEITTLHWHGMHLPGEMDGGPHQMVQPGQTWSPRWTIDQPPSTLWYHPHPHGQTATHVYRGIAGLFLLDPPDGEAVGTLPAEYGVDDIPLIVQDKEFDPSGRLRFEAGGDTAVGFIGDTILVNGTLGPFFDASTELVRLRLLNASASRIYRFGFSDERPFSMVATEGGLLPAPVELTHLQLTPAERAEIVVALSPGERVTLVSSQPDLGTRLAGTPLFGRGTFDVLELRAAEALAPSDPLPTTFAPLPAVDPALLTAQPDRTFRLGGRTINGRLMDMTRIDEVVAQGSTEVWELFNQSSQPHNFHVHDGQFRVVSIDGNPPPPELAGWKDTVYVAPNTTVRLVKTFAGRADPTVPYMYHCHLMVHEDQGMMGQLVVVPQREVEAATGAVAGSGEGHGQPDGSRPGSGLGHPAGHDSSSG